MKYLVANWKMKLTVAESVARAEQACAWYAALNAPSFELILCPSHCAIPAVGEALAGSKVVLGAQDMASEERASLTGATSSLHLKELGVGTVILGHSERRAHFGETDAVVREKVAAALNAGFRAILCVGETAEERAQGRAEEVVRRQIREGLRGAPAGALLIAYEPVWAIGAGEAVGLSDAQAQARVLKETLVDLGGAFDAPVPLLYGGSVDASNVISFTRDPLAGTLVGTASQSEEGLKGLVQALKTL